MVGLVRKYKGKCCRIVKVYYGSSNENPSEIDFDDDQEDNPLVEIEFIDEDNIENHSIELANYKSLKEDDDCILKELWK